MRSTIYLLWLVRGEWKEIGWPATDHKSEMALRDHADALAADTPDRQYRLVVGAVGDYKILQEWNTLVNEHAESMFFYERHEVFKRDNAGVLSYRARPIEGRGSSELADSDWFPTLDATIAWIDDATAVKDHILLVGFHLASIKREEAMRTLRILLSSAKLPIEGWWIAEDDRTDGTDNSSAIFVPKGHQAWANDVIEEQFTGKSEDRV